MVMAHRSSDPRIIAHTAGSVVVADWIFTATAVVLQPVTGIALARGLGWNLSEGWILLSLALYLVTGCFWLPVVWIQQRLRDLPAATATPRACLRPTIGSTASGFSAAFPPSSPSLPSSG